MRLILDENILDQAPENLLRQAGYAFLIDRNTGQESFVRSAAGGRGYYPRFHLYLSRQNRKVILNLHLDQKQASYAGAHAHNAEYDSEVVAAETARLRSLVTRDLRPMTQNIKAEAGQDILDKIRPKQFPAAAAQPEKERKKWWELWK